MKDLIFRKTFYPVMTLTIVLGVFLFSVAAYAQNIQKPLNTWADTDAIVYNNDSDDVIHFDITYDLDSFWAGIVADGSIDLGIYHSRGEFWKVVYFWVTLYSIDGVVYVDGAEGVGSQYIGGYYWGLFADEDGNPLHSYLTIPASYGAGDYWIEVKTRLGTWDYSFYSPWQVGPTFQVDSFSTSLPTPSGSMSNPGADSTVKVDVPAYDTFAGYDPAFPPSRYMIEISVNPSFPWDDGTVQPLTTVYAYPEVPASPSDPLTVYMDVSNLNHSFSTLYGRIRCLGPDDEWWTDSNTASLGTVNVTYWDPRLTTPPSGNITIVNDPTAQTKNDSTINVDIQNYTVSDVRHTGYVVEISETTDFTYPYYATSYYWHKGAAGEDAEEVDENVNFDVDLNLYVGGDLTDVWTTLPSDVYVRIRAVRLGYTSSIPSSPLINIAVSDTEYLAAPTSASLSNPDLDPLIEVTVNPATKTPPEVTETGYAVDFILGNEDFATTPYADQYHLTYTYDSDADGTADEVDVSSLTIDANMQIAVDTGAFTWGDILTYGVKAQVSSIRLGFTPSDPAYAGSASVSYSTSRLTTPPSGNITIVNDPTAQAKNDSTINVDIQNYTVSDARHTGYIVEISDSTTFDYPDYVLFTYWHLGTGPQDAEEVNEDVNLDIDLSLYVGTDPTDVWTSLPTTVYVRVRASRNGYAPSNASSPLINIAVSDTKYLVAPTSAFLSNSDLDPLVQLTVNPGKSRHKGTL
jgi:hypothetical protein